MRGSCYERSTLLVELQVEEKSDRFFLTDIANTLIVLIFKNKN